MAAGKTSLYRVRAFNDGGTSAYSNVATSDLEHALAVERQPELVLSKAVRLIEDQVDLALQGLDPLVEPDLDRDVDVLAVDRDEG